MKDKDPVTLTINSVLSAIIVLTLLFTSLKMSHAISWSWLWVFAPAWIPLVATIFALAIIVLIIIRTREDE